MLGWQPGSGAVPSCCSPFLSPSSGAAPSAPPGGIGGLSCPPSPSSGSSAPRLGCAGSVSPPPPAAGPSFTAAGPAPGSEAGGSSVGLPRPFSACAPGAGAGSPAASRASWAAFSGGCGASSGARAFSSCFSVLLEVLFGERVSGDPGAVPPSLLAAPSPGGGEPGAAGPFAASSWAPFSWEGSAALRSPSSPKSDCDLRNRREGGRLFMEPRVRTWRKDEAGLPRPVPGPRAGGSRRVGQ